MRIAVFIKRVLDPEIPAALFRLDAEAKDARVPDAPYVMGPYDENALEVALAVKDRDPETYVEVISYGPREAEEILRKALSVGADEAVLVLDEGGAQDVFSVGAVLAAAARNRGLPDLLLFGLQSGDWDSGQTAFVVAELLGAASVSYAAAVELEPKGGVRVRRILEDASEEILVPRGPVAMSVTSSGENALRMAKVRDILMAARKKITYLSAADLALQPRERIRVAAVAALEGRQVSCTFMAGDDAAAKGRALVQRLLAERMIQGEAQCM